MIDIETLGKSPNGAIVQIAALQFDSITGQTGNEFCINVDPVSSQQTGMHIDANTVLWWMKQEREAQKLVFETDVLPLGIALNRLNDFFGIDRQERIVWANGAQFDLSIINYALDLPFINLPRLWMYWNERDARTIYNLFPEVKKNHRFVGTAHNAIADCYNQVEILHKCYQRIFEK